MRRNEIYATNITNKFMSVRLFILQPAKENTNTNTMVKEVPNMSTK